MINELEKYFKETPREKIEADWKKSEHMDNIGITVEAFEDLRLIEKIKSIIEETPNDQILGRELPTHGRADGWVLRSIL